MLENNNCVRCLMIDCSEAFDTVDYTVLVKKLQLLGLPADIYNWLISSYQGAFNIVNLMINFLHREI